MMSEGSTGSFTALRAPLAACLMLTALMGNAVAESFSDGIQAFHRHDYAVAMRSFRPLAEQGEARAQFYLGYMYDNGWGVPRSAAQRIQSGRFERPNS